MATYVTYKSVIAQAIADFNAVQGALNTKDSTIASAADGSSGTSLAPTNELPSKIRDYLVFPKRTLKIDRHGIISVADPVVAGTNRTGYESVEVPQASTTVSGATVRITTAGWMDVGDAGTVATGKLYTLTRKAGETGDTYTVMGGVETSGYIAKTDPRPTLVIDPAKFSGGDVTVSSLKAGNITIAKTAEASQDSTVNLGSIGFADSMSDADKTAYPYYFKINTNVASSSGTVTKTAVSTTKNGAGYIRADKVVSSGDTQSITVGSNSKTSYVKLARATFELSGTNIIAKNTSANDSIGGSGYIKAGEIAFRLTSGTTTPVVDAASLVVPKVTITTTPSGIKTATSGEFYITVNGSKTDGSVKAKATVTEGYQSAGTVGPSAATKITPAVTGSGTKVYIQKGGNTHTLKVTPTVHDADDNLAGNSTTAPFTFYTDSAKVPTADYLQIEATNTCVVTEGYQTETTKSETKNIFIPKAVLQYVENSTDGSNFIQVKTGGYLPAGVLSDIAGFDSTTPDYAKIDAIEYSETPTFNSSNNTYTWTGSARVSSAGYLKDDTKISGDLSVAKATFTSTPSVVTAPELKFDEVNMGGISAGDGATNIITIPALTTKGTTRVTVKNTAGYIAAGTLTYDATVSALNKTKTISIANTNATSSATASILNHSARLGSGEAASGNKQGWAVSVSSVPNYPYVMLTSNSTATIPTENLNLGLLNSSKATSLAAGASVKYGTFDGGGTNDKTKSYAYIAAAVSPTVDGATATVSIGTVAVGTATQFDAVSGTKQANTKTASSGNKTASISGSTASLNDKYVCGTVSVSGTATANATASINSDASGANVDSYVESLFKRMLGQAYTAVSSD